MKFSINPLLDLITKLLLYSLIYMIPIILLLIANKHLLKVVRRKKDTDYYMIKDFDFNWCCVWLYIGGYFGTIAWVRINALNFTTDLKQYYRIMHVFFNNNVILNTVKCTLFVLSAVFVILMIIIIHRFFVAQLVKRYIIFNVLFPYMDLSPFLYFKINRKLTDIVLYLTLKIKNKNLSNIIWQGGHRACTFITTILPTTVLYLYFFYEICFNNYVLTPSFYKYLLFYFMYQTYKRVSHFIDETDYSINKILFALYYKQKTLKYANIPDNLREVIERYIQYGLSRNMSKYPEPLLDEILGAFSYQMSECCYHLVEDNQYSNGQYVVTINNDKDFDVLLGNFNYTKKGYYFIRKILYGKYE